MSREYSEKLNLFQFNWLVHHINWQALRRNKDSLGGKFLDVGCGEKPYWQLIKCLVNNYVGIE